MSRFFLIRVLLVSTLRNAFPGSQLERFGRSFVKEAVHEVLMKSIVSGEGYTIRTPKGDYLRNVGTDGKYPIISDMSADIMLKDVHLVPFYFLSDTVCSLSYHLLDLLLRFN